MKFHIKSALFAAIRHIFLLTVILSAAVQHITADDYFFTKHVLLISNGDIDNYVTSVCIDGIKQGLGPDVDLRYQFMELDHINDDSRYTKFYNRTKDYILTGGFDAVMSIGDDAFRFALLYRDELFNGKPVIFLGVDDPELIREGIISEAITGIKDVLFFDENVLLARRLFPGVKTIHLITDNSYLGINGSQIFNELKFRFKGINFVEINTELEGLDGTEAKLSQADKTDVVFYLSGKGLSTSSEKCLSSLVRICEEKNLPVFGCSFSSFDAGVLGGYTSSYLDMGRLAGKMAQEIFSGVDTRYLNVISECPADYVFDYAMMKKYGIKKSQLTPDTYYINDVPSVATNGFLLLILSVLVAVGILLAVYVHIRQIRKLKGMREILEENRRMLHAVMDQSETVYWECDFSQEGIPVIEDEVSNENLEELESVDDETPLGKMEFSSDEELLEIPAAEEPIFNGYNIQANDVVQGWIYSGVIQREYREQFNQILQDFKDGRTKKSIEIDIPIGIEDIRNNVQTERWKHIVYRAIKTENEKVVRAICSATDVTSQKRAEREYEGIMKYQSFVQQNYPAYTRLNLTKNLVLERFINIPGLSKGIKGNSAVSELEFIRGIITGQNQNKSFAASLDREELIIAFKNGARQKTCDFCYHVETGSVHWFSLCMELAFNPSSGDIEAYCYLKDITSQTIAAITKDSVLEDDVEYIFWLNTVTGVCQFINKADTVNWIAESDTIDYQVLLNTFIKKKVPDPDKEDVRNLFDINRIKKELNDSNEVRFTYHTRKDDGSIEIKQEKVYFLEPGSNVIVFVSTDITAITMMENQQNEKLAKAIKDAERANYAKSDFLSRMSHDLRTPMNGILGIAELASRELNDPEKLGKDIEKIRSSSSYMLGLLNDILDMSKIESGKMEIRKSRVSFGEILENAITLSHVMCDKNGITFYCNLNPDDYRNFIINVDRLHLQQVVMNLISNASKFTPAGGNIDLLISSETKEDGNLSVKAIVKDTGAGMTKEFQEIMYDAFTQDSNSINKVGTGLGLAIVRNLVKLMNGTISCVSAPGEGTEFTIMLDVDKSDFEIIDEGGTDKKPGVAAKVDEKKLSLNGKRALLVEDNELNQEIASRLLMDEGLEVEIAGNGLEALNMFSEKELGYYDVVLMDVMMPVMDGLQSAHLMRGLDREDAKKVPIIAMTANAFTEDIERCLEAGMNTHIAKPIDPDKMIETIKGYIGV